MKIPFTKAHGAKNDFLLTWRHDAPDGDHARDRPRHLRPPHRRRRRRLDARHAAGGCRGRRRHPALQFRRQRGRNLRQRHALRRGLSDPPRVRRRQSCASAPARASRRCACCSGTACTFEFEMNMGRAGDHGRPLRSAAFRRARAMSPCCASAIRSAPCRCRISISTGAPWAPKSNRIRTFPTAPTSRLSAGRRTHDRRALLRARRGRNHELRARARPAPPPRPSPAAWRNRPSACSLPPVPSAFVWKETSTSPVPPQIVAEGVFHL